MDVHKGSGYPCSSCHKSLSSYKMLRQHKAACKLGRKHTCVLCKKEYSSLQVLKTHEKVQHGATQPQPGQSFLCPHCGKAYLVKKSMREHVGTCAQNPSRKGPYYCRVEGCPKVRHPFSRIKNLNSHMAGAHGWKECKGVNSGGVVNLYLCNVFSHPECPVKVVTYTLDLVTLLLVLYI